MKKSKTSVVFFDWKDNGIEEWTNALKAFGLRVYKLPSCDGSDNYGFIISDRKLTKKQLKQKDTSFFGSDGEEGGEIENY